MSTADVVPTIRTSADAPEADLAALFATSPSALVLDRLDRRVCRGIAAWRPRPRMRSRLRPGRRAAFTVLVAATFALGGATGSLQGLYQFLAFPFDTPWHRGQDIGLSQTVDGYTVTIDRAYADATRLALAISVIDDRRRPNTTQVEAFSAVVTDAAGEYQSGGGAVSGPDGPFAAVNVTWKQPPELPLPAGPRQLHVVLPFIQVRDDTTPPPDADAIGWSPWNRVAGPWTFDFEVTVDGGTAITPAASAELGGVRVSVPRLIAASNIVRVEMRIDGALPPGDWSPIGEVRHDGRTMRFVSLSMEEDGSLVILTDGGVNDASGTWTITVDELVGNETNTNLPGPWVLEFEAP